MNCSCACGCGLPAPSRKGARYATAACRTRDWKQRQGITGIRYVRASQNAKSSGVQLSWGRAVYAVALHFAKHGMGWEHGREMIDPSQQAVTAAEQLLMIAVPDRQRALIRARNTKT